MFFRPKKLIRFFSFPLNPTLKARGNLFSFASKLNHQPAQPSGTLLPSSRCDLSHATETASQIPTLSPLALLHSPLDNQRIFPRPAKEPMTHIHPRFPVTCSSASDLIASNLPPRWIPAVLLSPLPFQGPAHVLLLHGCSPASHSPPAVILGAASSSSGLGFSAISPETSSLSTQVKANSSRPSRPILLPRFISSLHCQKLSWLLFVYFTHRHTHP